MDAGEAFAALGHQIGVTGAVHFRVHHSIWKAAVKEIGARSTKDTMDSFNIKRRHHKQTPADPADPCCCPSSFCRHRCSPHRGTLWARAKLRLQGQKDLGWNSPLCHLLVLWLRQSHSHPQSPHMLKRDVNTYSKAGYGRSGEMTSGSHQHSTGEMAAPLRLLPGSRPPGSSWPRILNLMANCLHFLKEQVSLHLTEDLETQFQALAHSHQASSRSRLWGR